MKGKCAQKEEEFYSSRNEFYTVGHVQPTLFLSGTNEYISPLCQHKDV